MRADNCRDQDHQCVSSVSSSSAARDLNELRAIAVSAQVHSGWLEPRVVERADGTVLPLIEKTPESTHLGSHAFVIVG